MGEGLRQAPCFRGRYPKGRDNRQMVVACSRPDRLRRRRAGRLAELDQVQAIGSVAGCAGDRARAAAKQRMPSENKVIYHRIQSVAVDQRLFS